MAKIKVVDRKASDNEYMHKDFHGGLCYAIKYLDENYGPDETDAYFRQVARSYFKPLIEALAQDGLSAIEKHFRDVFTREQGRFKLFYDGDTLVLDVLCCPAIEHLKKTNRFYTPRFCRSTVVLNDTICADAGYRCSCEYEPGQGRCVQKFWKKG